MENDPYHPIDLKNKLQWIGFPLLSKKDTSTGN